MNPRFIDVAGLGASTLDVLTRVDQFPSRREVRQALGTVIQGGGPVATALVAVARLGGSTAMIDSLGDDWAGRFILEDFQREGVRTEAVEIHPGCTTSVSTVLVSAADGARAILFQPGSAPGPRLSDSQKALIRSARILHISGRHFQACLQAAELAAAHGVRLSFDGGADRYRPELRELVPRTDICIAARDFAERYTGETEAGKAAARLLAEGPRIAAVTDGIDGSWICTRDGPSFHQPAYRFPGSVDTTGCGDSYHGAFLFGLARGWPLEECAALASAVAGLNSLHLGGRAGLPTLEQARKTLDEGPPKKG